ncbi:MAG: SWIM zinc finger family protein [Mastigocoleus sp. MO_167.B18]|nr:SWIM zinc finger family protein [Mastigocoleus sp. MO_167.B18]
MSANWTSEQILALSPDASSTKNGKALANPGKWSSLGHHEQVIWGEFLGSGKNPYRTQIDLTEPAFKCTCPSRKFPCKHALGLFLLFANDTSKFSGNVPPEWVISWLDSRKQRKAKQTERVKKEVDPTTQAKRAQKRLDKVTAGMQDLELWLRDLIRQGLATVQGESYSFWDGTAARLVDAQAPGVARLVRQMGSIPFSGEGWQERLLAQLGKVYLLIEGFKNLDKLSPEVQADIRTQIGWTQTKEELSKKQGIKDSWLILGQNVEEEDRLRAQRIWLWGKQTQQTALILNFAHGSQPFDTSLAPGTCIDAELVFFESAYPLRAIMKNRDGILTPLNKIPGSKTIAETMQTCAQALARNPWIEQFPVALHDVIPNQKNGIWFVYDAHKHPLPIQPKSRKNWQILALSGGYPLDIFGEWDGEYFLPLSVWTDNMLVSL